MLDSKTRTGVSIFFLGTGASVTPGKRNPRRKNIKSLAMLPPRKDQITNQYINMLGTGKDQSLPPQLAKFCPGYKSIKNKAEDGRNDSTDTSLNDKEDYVDNLKSIYSKNIDDKYKDDSL